MPASLASEFITNALLHAWFAPEDQVRLEVRIADRLACIEACDPGPGFLPGMPPVPLQNALGGKGLYFVQQLALRRDVEADGQTCVWAELPIAS